MGFIQNIEYSIECDACGVFLPDEDGNYIWFTSEENAVEHAIEMEWLVTEDDIFCQECKNRVHENG